MDSSDDSNMSNSMEYDSNNSVSIVFSDELHYTVSFLKFPDSSDEESEEEIESTYDPMITPTHSYLGDTMEEVRSLVLFDDGAIIEDFPLILEKYSFIHPGQLFPMVVNMHSTKEMLRKCKADKSSVFGIIFVAEQPFIKISKCGIVAEILECYDNGYELRLKARGRQRFKLLKSTQRENITYGKIQILPETKPKSSLECTKIAVLDNHRTMNETGTPNLKKRRQLERYDASLTPWPEWVHNYADPWKLTKRIKKYLSPWQKRIRIPDDPNELSYWLGRNLPMKDSIRDKLLSMTNATPRLHYYDKFLSKKRILVCALCKNFVSKTKNMFPMTPEGLQSVYTNPQGYLFEAVTLTKVSSNLKLTAVGSNSFYSWFPGYMWTPACCKTCNKHSGWLFTATKPELKPKIFWALIGKRLRLADYAKIKKNRSSEQYKSEDSLHSIAVEFEN